MPPVLKTYRGIPSIPLDSSSIPEIQYQLLVAHIYPILEYPFPISLLKISKTPRNHVTVWDRSGV